MIIKTHRIIDIPFATRLAGLYTQISKHTSRRAATSSTAGPSTADVTAYSKYKSEISFGTAPHTCNRAHAETMDEAGISLFNEAAAEIPPQNHLQFITVNDLRKRLRLLRKAGENESIRVVISSATEAKIDESLEKLDFRKSTRLMWEEAVASGILRLLPSPFHDITSSQFFINIIAKVATIPGHTANSIRGVGRTRYRVPGKRSKEADEAIQCATRRWSDWPNLVIEVVYLERIAYLRHDARWWLVHSQGAVKLVIIIHVTHQPDSLHIELWGMQANPNPRTRNAPPNIPVATGEIDIDALGTVTPPMATITIPYDILFDAAHPNAQDTVLTAAELSDIATTIYQGF